MSKGILIVEDEPMIAEDLRIVVESLGYQIMAVADNAEGAISMIQKDKPDLIFLDVQLKGEMDGVDLAAHINANLNIPFLFLTSYFDDHTVSRIRQVKPLAYIVKPFKDSDIKVNLGLAFQQLQKSSPQVKIDDLFVRKGGDLKRLDPEDILWIKGEDNYSTIYCADGEKYTLSQTLKSLEHKFSASGFLRIQKGYVVRISAISSISGNSIFIGDEHLPIGKAYRKEFFERITVL